jgi:Fic family protein
MMSEVVRQRWEAPVSSGLPRRDRRPCEYEAYLPDALTGRRFVFHGDTVADLADAEAAVIRLNVEAHALVDTEALARLLLRAEAVASSRIEGLEVGARRLLRAEAAQDMGEPTSDVTATEVLGNIEAMSSAVNEVSEADTITMSLLLDMHRSLLAGTRLAKHGGQLRAEQNWIGGSSYNPCSAVFVPPPPEHVETLMDDLVAFCNTDDLPAIAQAAIAHAQFETIHPFVDGNGRVGRALVHRLLRRRGLAPRVIPPVSLILATWAEAYVDGLTGYRYQGDPDSAAAVDGINAWTATFATACTRAVTDAMEFEDRTAKLEQDWRERLGRVRAGSATDLLLRRLPGAPILTIESAAALTGRTFKPAAEAVERLVAAGVLKQVTAGRRNRAYEATDVIAAFTDLERRLAVPEPRADNAVPVRRVPAGRQPP